MPASFFDTSALQHKYIKSTYTRRIRSIVTRSQPDCIIADRTVVEMASTLARTCRGNNWGMRRFDLLHHYFMQDLAADTLRVRACGDREVRRAIHLIRFAGVVKKKSLSSGDGVIAACALESALETQQIVNFYTSDRRLFLCLRDLNAFRTTMNLFLVGETHDGTPPVCRALGAG